MILAFCAFSSRKHYVHMLKFLLVAALLCVLTATFFVSILLTALSLGSFVIFRLAFLLVKDGRPGLSTWVDELKGYLLQTIRATEQNEKSTSLQDDSRSDSTNDSGILVQSEKATFDAPGFEPKTE